MDKWDRWILHQEEEKQKKKKETASQDPKEPMVVSNKPEAPRMKEKEPLTSPTDEYRASLKHQMEREIEATIDEDIRSAARELIEEQWKAIRQVSEEHKQVIREVVEEEKVAIRERVKNLQRLMIELGSLESAETLRSIDLTSDKVASK